MAMLIISSQVGKECCLESDSIINNASDWSSV